jgi:hypothetical protein
MTRARPWSSPAPCEGRCRSTRRSFQGCGGALQTAHQLCRRELDRFRRAVATGAAVTVGCTQEAPLFAEVAGESGAAERVRFANVREFGGWSNEAEEPAPRWRRSGRRGRARAARVPRSMESEGVALVYGRDEVAVEAAHRLSIGSTSPCS